MDKKEFPSIVAAVKCYADMQPDKIAIADVKNARSYGELLSDILHLAGVLTGMEIQKGDYVIAECTQDEAYIALDLACEYIGAIFVPVEAGATVQRVSPLVEETGAKLIVARQNYEVSCRQVEMKELLAMPASAQLPEMCADADDVAEVLFSTGTTGVPKGIVLSNRANVAIAENIIGGTGMHKDSAELVPLPLSHSHGLRTCYAHLVNGSTTVIGDGILNVAAFFTLIEKYQVNAIDLAPTMAKILLKIAKKGLEKNADRIDYIELGTEALDEETKKQLKQIFSRSHIFNFYGSTEAGRSCVLDITTGELPGCVGYPSCNSKIIITDENRKVIESSEDNMGLLAISGAMMMEGYFNSPQLTSETLVDGIIYTTDLGYIDKEGRVFVKGRANDVINYKGIKIAPDEIEGVAGTCDWIKDCAVIGVSDPLCGQVPKLFIVVNDASTFVMEDYRAYLKERLDLMRMPKEIEVMDAIPRTSNGKVLRKELVKLNEK